MHVAPTVHLNKGCDAQHAKSQPCLTLVLCTAQLVRPVEASTEVLRDVHTQQYLDELHSSSRKVCPAEGTFGSQCGQAAPHAAVLSFSFREHLSAEQTPSDGLLSCCTHRLQRLQSWRRWRCCRTGWCRTGCGIDAVPGGAA
jgi:hypothetical protein